MKFKLISDPMIVAGFALFCVGMQRIYEPLGLVFAGILLVIVGLGAAARDR